MPLLSRFFLQENVYTNEKDRVLTRPVRDTHVIAETLCACSNNSVGAANGSYSHL